MTPSTPTAAVVIGAGISGLTTGVVLAEADVKVRIISASRPDQTDSAKAGASWGPYMVSHDRVTAWSAETYKELEKIAGHRGSGIRLLPGVEAFTEDGYRAWSSRTAVPPAWATQIPSFEERRRGGDERGLPRGYFYGWHYTIPIVNMPAYLEYLTHRFKAAGGDLITGSAVESFDGARELAGFSDREAVVVNCSGLGSYELVPDSTMAPTMGQLVIVRNPGIGEFFQDNPVPGELESTHIFPQGDIVVIGGCDRLFQPGDPWIAAEPDPLIRKRILERAEAIRPELRGVEVLAERVGLRPVRTDQVRVEWDRRRSLRLIHNYGHGGAGVTLSWGCALKVGRLFGVLSPSDESEAVGMPTLGGVLAG
ncbi:FAD-dependent oxidoreductase [Phytomonospora sp. NPDC050363]|uniref:FAD-dependent oxidoreductase n=1 Tax=Phytomonospora sp. NPDC050363 TaxID=3155642 RepID=UPI0033CE86A0